MLRLVIVAALMLVGLFLLAPGAEFAWSAYGYGGPRYVVTEDPSAYFASLAMRAGVGALAIVAALLMLLRSKSPKR